MNEALLCDLCPADAKRLAVGIYDGTALCGDCLDQLLAVPYADLPDWAL